MGTLGGVMRFGDGTSDRARGSRRKAVFSKGRNPMDKPFKTIAEQVSILESLGMRTDEATPLILKREGCYSVVNGYKTLFLSC